MGVKSVKVNGTLIKFDNKKFLINKQIKNFDDFKKKFSEIYDKLMKHDYEKIQKELQKMELNDSLKNQMCDILNEEIKKDGKDYKDFFNKKLKKYGVESPEDLSDKDRKKFFDEVDKDWDAKNETD